jgi:hypothetical protein
MYNTMIVLYNNTRGCIVFIILIKVL